MTEEKTGFSLKIFHKILLTMIVVALIPLSGLLYIGGYQLEQDWRQNANLSLTLTADGLGGKVNGWVDTNLRALRENAVLPDLVSMDATRQKPILKALQDAYEWAYLVFTVGRDGQNIGRSDDNPLQYYGDRDYFKQVSAGQPIGQQVVIGKTSQKPALILAGPIRNAAGSTVGALAMAMQLADVSQVVASAKIGATGFAILVDQNNKAIAHGRPEQVAEALQDLSAHPALQSPESAQAPIIYREGGKRIVAYTQKTSLGWTLIVQQDYDDAFAPLLEARQRALFLIAGALVLVVAVAYLLSRQLASPIWELTAVAENISRGHFDRKIVGTERRDEIGALARAIERMAASIKLAFERLRKKP
ncbi:MAG: cache domain-containing protein [Candidatus Competibacter sp.]|nr:cache domain-containing protein [Candidatus Competibacter sp.]MDG4585008.1 cache domain-containing protein [Candidatus Competibacter sp.]